MPTSNAKCAVFLDRDGVVNSNAKFANRPEDFHLIDGVKDALRDLKQAGFLIVLVTNQGGISEDLQGKVTWSKAPLTREMLSQVHAKMVEDLGPDSAFDSIKFCPHATDAGCSCRKPKPGMLVSASEELNIDLTRSYMIGDSATDIQAGLAASTTPILVLSGNSKNEREKCPPETIVLADLKQCASFILGRQTPQASPSNAAEGSANT